MINPEQYKSIIQESVLEFSKKVMQAFQQTVSYVLLQVPNALKIVFFNREDGDQVGVIQQRISLNGVENASIALSFLVTNKLCSLLIPSILNSTDTFLLYNNILNNFNSFSQKILLLAGV